jgi:hypothetical protein
MARCQSCGLLIGGAATFCPTCGALAAAPSASVLADPDPRTLRRIRRWALVSAAVVLVVVAAVAAYAAFSHGSAPLKPIASPASYRLAQFSQLRIGMSSAQVAGVLGTAGSATAAGGLAGSAPQFYLYLQNGDGQSLQLLFQNGLLSQKVACGLR